MTGIFKKIGIVFGILIGLFVVTAITVPFFVNVDKFRPQIESAVNQKLNGKLELGKLSLSLWGQIRVQIDGMQLTDAHGNKVMSVKDAYFHLPFSSVLGGSPSLVLNLRQPELLVVKEKNGKLNVMTLMKPSAETGAAQPTTPQTAPQPTAPSETKLPGIVTRARLGVEITGAHLTYRDEVGGVTSEVKNLSLIAHGISLTHKMTLEVIADLDTEMKGKGKQAGISVKGPAKLTMTADPKVSGGKFESVDLIAKASLDDLDILMPDFFHKEKGVDAHADLSVKASPDAAQIDQLFVKFYNAEIQGKGTVTHLSASAGTSAEAKPSPVVNFSMKSNVIDLKPWNKLVPMLAQYDLGGNAELTAEANGPADKLGYKALFKINGLTAKAPHLKAEPRFDGVISVITDQVDHLALTMKAPGNDLEINGKIVNFQAPKMDFQITSNGLDLDQLIETPQATTTAQGKKEAAPEATTTGQATAKSDIDSSLDPLRTNKALQSMVANVTLNLRSIKSKGMVINDVLGKMSMRDLIANIESFSMKMFGGTIKANASTNLRPHAPTYKFGTTVAGLDLAKAVESQMKSFKNTVVGKASFEMSGTGSSFNTDAAMANLLAKGKFKVDNAAFTTMDVGKMVAEGLGSAISKVSDKIPGLKGKTIGGLPGGESRYDTISSDFTIANGRFSAPDFVAKATANKGIDLKGDVAVGLKDQSLKANFMITDTYNLTKAKDISVNQGGLEINHILAEGNKPVQFPISVGCTLSAPCYSYTQVPEYLLKVALNNATGGLKNKAQSELEKRAKDLLKGAGGGGGGNPLGNLKGLFGH